MNTLVGIRVQVHTQHFFFYIQKILAHNLQCNGVNSLKLDVT